MSASLGCLLLGTAEGERLRDWYRAAFDGVDTERGGLRFGDVELVIDERDDLHVTAVEPGRLSLTFVVPDLGVTQARLRRLGTRWTDWASATDPDGNVVDLVEAVGRVGHHHGGPGGPAGAAGVARR